MTSEAYLLTVSVGQDPGHGVDEFTVEGFGSSLKSLAVGRIYFLVVLVLSPYVPSKCWSETTCRDSVLSEIP